MAEYKTGHTGSWGLPDYGLTERIGNLFGASQNYQGGSDLTPRTSQPGASFQPTFTTPTYQTKSGPIQGSAPGYIAGIPAGQAINYLNQNDVLGTSTSGQTPTPTPTQNTGGSTGGYDMNNVDDQNRWARDNGFMSYAHYQDIQRSNADSERRQREAQEAMNREIEGLYNPVMSSLGQQESDLKQTGQEQMGLLGQRYTSQGEQLQREKQLSEANLAEQRRLTEQGALSANEQARRAFRSLQQQAQARFGGRGSAGMAATEIASKEFARQQGGLNTALTNALAQFGLEGQRLSTFVLGKKDELDSWRNEAEQTIQSAIRDGLAQIGKQRGMIESAKAEARLNLLREGQQLARNIANQDRQLKADLAANAINSGQQLAQRMFTPQETAAIWNGMFAQQLSGIGGIGQAAGAAGPQLIGMGRRSEDEIG